MTIRRPWFAYRRNDARRVATGDENIAFHPVRWPGWMVAILLCGDVLLLIADRAHWFGLSLTFVQVALAIGAAIALTVVCWLTSVDVDEWRNGRDLRDP